MRVLSWNLWWRFGGGWRQRQEAIIATLQSLEPDVVGLQEVWGAGTTTQAQVLGERLGMYAAFGSPSLPPPPHPPESPDQAGVEVGVAVLSRWPVLRVREHRLPSAHRAAPIALLATIGHPAGELHIAVSCVDWELDRASQRLAQTRALGRLAMDSSLDGPMPVLLAADLNAPPDTPEIEALTEIMVDAWTGGGGDEGHTLSSDNPLAPRDAWQLDQRIDYILARPGTPDRPPIVRTAFLAGDAVGGVQPSDHYAVVADLEM